MKLTDQQAVVILAAYEKQLGVSAAAVVTLALKGKLPKLEREIKAPLPLTDFEPRLRA